MKHERGGERFVICIALALSLPKFPAILQHYTRMNFRRFQLYQFLVATAPSPHSLLDSEDVTGLENG